MANKFKRFNKTNEEIIVKSENVEGLSSLLGNKVSVVTGKQLSTNDFTNTDKSNVSANTSARHTHSNKGIIDKITQAFIDNWTAAYTHISDTVKHVTAAERTNWNGAATSQHTHSNKSVLDGITSTLVSNWNSAYTHISDAIKHITATERTNWNSAKSKADAALPASSYTAADILKKLLTVDGSGSKLDADLLDGKEATNFASSTHTHTVSSIGAANAKHKHSTLDIVRGGNENWAGNIGSTDRGMINTARSPKSAFLPANCITVEYSSDAGKTWEDYGLSEAQKRDLFAVARHNDVKLSKSSPVSTNDCVRITIEPLDRYVSFDQLYIWFSIGSHTCTLDLERSTIGAKDTFSFIRKDVPLNGWSGPNMINFPYGTFGGGVSQTGNNYKYRMTFKTTKLGSITTQSPTINDIRFYGDNAWAIPNDMVKGDYPFSWDRDMNVNFSKQLKEQGKRVYSDNNKPTPAAIGAATAEQGIKADAALPKSGGTMTGFITLHAAPTANMHPATKKYVDDKMIAAGNGDMTKAVYDPGGRELPYIPKQDVDALAWGGDFGASGTPVSIAYAGAQRIASITAYGENAQGGTTEAPVALTGVDEVLVAGNNLCPKGILKTITREGVTFTHNPDGSVSVQGTASKNADYYYFGQYNMPNSNSVKLGTGKYTLSGCPSNIILYLIDIEKIIASQLNSTPVVFTKPLMEITCVLIRVPEGKTVNKTVYPMLNIGATALPYEPYNGSITPLPIPRPLRRVGDVKDKCVTRVKSVYDKRIVLDGSEDWRIYLNPNNFRIPVSERIVKGLSDSYPTLKPSEIGTQNGIYLSYTLEIIVTDLACSTVEEFKAHLSTHPITVHYQSTTYDGTNGLDVCLTEYQTGYIESYADESITTAWISSTGALSTGAEVAYVLSSPEVYATDPLDIDNAAGPLTVMTGGELEVRMTELLGTRSPELAGKMDKATYDADGDGVVDAAAAVPWSGVTGKPNTFPPSTHKHTKSEITDFPVSLKNPAALAISLNGTSQGTYDGSVAKSVNITPAGIGALGRTEKAADSSKLAGLTPVVDNPGPSNRNTWYFPFTGTNNKDGTRKYYAALYADHATTSGRANNLSMGLNGSDLWVYYS